MTNRWKMLSAAGNQGGGPVYGQDLFETSGSFVVPAGVTTISVVAIGGGGGASSSPGTGVESGAGGGGGGLGYVNNISVTPGETLTVNVGTGGAGGASGTASGANGGDTELLRGTTVLVSGLGGTGGQSLGDGTTTFPGGSFTGDGGGNGGSGGASNTNQGGGGGGGAGGYSGNGGNGGTTNNGTGASGTGGAGGGGGGQSTAGTQNNGGGGVGVLGEGSSGAGGGVDSPGTGGSIINDENGVPSGESGQAGGVGGLYGGGGGGAEDDTTAAGANGGNGALRIIYPGNLRSFPSTLTRDVDENGDVIVPPISLGLTGSLFNISGTNDAWTTQTVDISAYANTTARLVFKYVNTGNVFDADIQLDNIQFDGNVYSFENVTHNFETSQVGNGTNEDYTVVAFTALTVTENLDGFWQVDQGGTPSTGTARTDADDGTFYVYAETSAPANTAGFTFWLRSPAITLSANPTLQFAEARTGTIGTLDVYLDITSV